MTEESFKSLSNPEDTCTDSTLTENDDQVDVKTSQSIPVDNTDMLVADSVKICGAEEKEFERQTADDEETKCSKRKLKRLARSAEKRARLLANRAEERKRKKIRKKENREKGIDMGPSRRQLKHCTMASSSCKVRVAIDMDFDELMTDRDCTRTYVQLQFAYAANRRASNPLQLHVVNFGGKTRQAFDKVQGTNSWDINLSKEDLLSNFDKEDLVYLTSDSPDVLEDLNDTKVYVIGGLLDHNHFKGLCYNRAQEKGLKTARLPIEEFLEMKSRKVLTINQVFEILVRFTECKDWQSSVFSVIPKRKCAVIPNRKCAESKQQ